MCGRTRALRGLVGYVVAVAVGSLLLAGAAAGQQVPISIVQEALVKATLLTFNDANVTGNYDVLYAKLSKPFRDKFPPERLKETFKVFAEKQVDFKIIAAKDPIAKQEPRVSDRGVLSLYGYFDTTPSRVNYELEFIMADGEWKPIRIDVNIRAPDGSILSTVKPVSGRRVALVIGNSAYLMFPSIPNPHNDAVDLAAALKSLDFEVSLGVDLKRREMEDVLIRFARDAREADTALIFYAGHGLQYQGVNYLAPVDAQIKDEADLRRLVALQDVIRDLQGAGRVRILIVDACRDNDAIRQIATRLPATRAASFSRGLARVEGAEGLLVAFATQPNRVAADGRGRNSPLTKALLKHILTPGLELRTLMPRVRADVVAVSSGAQRPEVWDSLVGEFSFRSGSSRR